MNRRLFGGTVGGVLLLGAAGVLVATAEQSKGPVFLPGDQPVTEAVKTPGVSHAVAFVGFDGATFTNAPNTGVIFVPLKPFAERRNIPKEKILADLRGKIFSDFSLCIVKSFQINGMNAIGSIFNYLR